MDFSREGLGSMLFMWWIGNIWMEKYHIIYIMWYSSGYFIAFRLHYYIKSGHMGQYLFIIGADFGLIWE